MIASKNKVYAYTLDTYELINQYEMPSPMSFQEEGGVSLHPNGRKFIAVSLFIYKYINYHLYTDL